MTTALDPDALERLSELRGTIAKHGPIVDTPADQYAHNVVSLTLAIIAKEYGVAAANEAINDYGLGAKGWHQQDVPEEKEEPS